MSAGKVRGSRSMKYPRAAFLPRGKNTPIRHYPEMTVEEKIKMWRGIYVAANDVLFGLYSGTADSAELLSPIDSLSPINSLKAGLRGLGYHGIADGIRGGDSDGPTNG